MLILGKLKIMGLAFLHSGSLLPRVKIEIMIFGFQFAYVEIIVSISVGIGLCLTLLCAFMRRLC